MIDLSDLTKIKRNPNKIKSYLKVKDNYILTTKDLYIVFPKKFVDRKLSILANRSYILGAFATFDENLNYSISIIPARLEVLPASVTETEINGIEYVILTIKENDVYIANKKVIQNSDIVFPLYDLLISKGKVPFYYKYEDLANFFKNLKKYTGSKAGNNTLIFEVLTAIISRDKKNLNKEFRSIIRTREDVSKKEIAFVGLENIWLSYKTTLNKIAGAYMSQGIVAATIDKEEKISDLEHIIRE